MQTKVSDLLAVKGSDVICINRNVSVFEANKTLVNNNVGAVLVRDEKEKLAGIYTERDVLKQSVRRSDQLKTTLVKDVMTTDLIIGLSDDKIDYLMGIMTFNKIRHIPILENG